MAFDVNAFNEFKDRLNKNKSALATMEAAKDAPLSMYSGGLQFKETDELFFDTDAQGEPTIIENNSLANQVFTCAATLNGKTIVEVFPSMLGRYLTEYVPAGGGFVPTAKVESSEPPQGSAFTNVYDFWKAVAGKKIRCSKVREINTLAYNQQRLQRRKVYTWELVK